MGSPKDKKRFQQFYEANFDKVFRFVLFRVKGNREKAEDLVSEIFMKALEHFEDYDETRGKSAWLMMIARNHVISSWRDERITTVSLTTENEDGDQV
ncbi:MAG TPA: sigma factor, partial [Patescibacteria group bacterium]|nr:sigma factor [Patescibacteria group bacterium]